MQISAARPSAIPGSSETKPQDYVPSTNTAPVQEPSPGLPERRADIEKAVNIINKTLEIYNHDVKFAVHEKTHRVMVQVIDKKTEEVISELPPKQILDMLAAFQEMVGLIIDKKA